MRTRRGSSARRHSAASSRPSRTSTASSARSCPSPTRTWRSSTPSGGCCCASCRGPTAAAPSTSATTWRSPPSSSSWRRRAISSYEPEGVGELPGPEYTGTGKGKTPKEKLSAIIDVINERFGTDFDAQDLVDGVTDQLVADEDLQQAARVNDKGNFSVPFQEALDDALVTRHDKHGDFINKVFQDEALGDFFRAWMLDQVYGRLRAPAPK